ncbi:MAG: glycosyltransferase family 1 protein [Patescibacteria group bacterium]
MHIVIDARIRLASTGKPVERLLEYLQGLDSKNLYTILLAKDDLWQPTAKNFTAKSCPYPIFSFNPINQITLALFIARLRPDLVHFTLTGQQPIFYFGKQTTFTHDLTMLRFVRPGRLPNWLHKIRMWGYRFLLWQSHKKAEKILVPSEFVRDDVYKKYLFTRRKIVVTPEASEPPISASEVEPKDPPTNFLLYVGTAFPHKNLTKLVDAFAELKLKHPDLKLIFVGKREYHSKQLEKSIKNNPNVNDIIFTGFIELAELKWYYNRAAVYVFPSLSEGFGLPGLEAMAHGCPVASSNATCLPEVCKDAAEYFDPENAQDMTKAIQKILGNPKRRAELVANGKKVVAGYSWKRMVEQTLQVFNDIF